MGGAACCCVVILFRNCPPGVRFYWEVSTQPAARWHRDDEGPAQYLATSPDAAWAEFLRHEAITDPADLAGIERAIWAIDVSVELAALADPVLPLPILTGDETSYPECQAEAWRLREAGASGLKAPSAAVDPVTASGHRTDGGLVPGPPIDEATIVLYGLRPDDPGWFACAIGRPSIEQLKRVRHL
jgi:hypothetical protein